MKKIPLLLFCGLFLAAGNGLAQSPAGDGYTLLDYDAEAVDNPVARLAARLQSGEEQLQYQGEHGYLESLLKALKVDPASQVLVFSPTSLQYKLISPETPRALYFSDRVYIGAVQNSTILEIATRDDKLGVVFYTLGNAPEPEPSFERAGQRCLVCHDSQGTMGGGVPLLMALSGVYSDRNNVLMDVSGNGNINDRTPLRDRWGGWYVTGRSGKQTHLGNVLLKGPEELPRLDEARLGNLDTLAGLGFLDTDRYLTATSDIVALLVLEHQITVENQLTYVKFKAPAVLARIGLSEAATARDWDALPEKAQRSLTRMMDRLVSRMFFIDAAEFEDRISGSVEFTNWFQSQGPRDGRGRSLRDLDLKTHLFKYPLSFLIYSEDFDTLPAYARDYVYRKIAAVLEGRDDSDTFAYLSAADRNAVLEILQATKPDFVPYLTNHESARDRHRPRSWH